MGWFLKEVGGDIVKIVEINLKIKEGSVLLPSFIPFFSSFFFLSSIFFPKKGKAGGKKCYFYRNSKNGNTNFYTKKIKKNGVEARPGGRKRRGQT